MLRLSLNRSRAVLRPRSACVGSGVVNCTLLPAPTPHQPPERRLDKENSQSTTWQTSHAKHFMFGWFIAQKQPELNGVWTGTAGRRWWWVDLRPSPAALLLNAFKSTIIFYDLMENCEGGQSLTESCTMHTESDWKLHVGGLAGRAGGWTEVY